MKLILLFFLATAAFAADWAAVESIGRDRNIEVTTRNGTRTRAMLAAANGDALTVREPAGERTFSRTEIRRVRVADPKRRIRSGLIWTAVGAAVGALTGELACVSCPNEGHGYEYVGPGLGIGAGIGTLRFLRSPYRTVYDVK